MGGIWGVASGYSCKEVPYFLEYTPPLNKGRPHLHAGGKLGGKANKRRVSNRGRGRGTYARKYVRDDLWPRAFYYSTATVQTLTLVFS